MDLNDDLDNVFLSNLIIEVVPADSSGLPVLLSYSELAVGNGYSFTFQDTSYEKLEEKLSEILPRYKSTAYEIAFEHKKGEYVLIDSDHALRMMLFLFMKRERANQIVNGTLKWARKGFFSG